MFQKSIMEDGYLRAHVCLFFMLDLSHCRLARYLYGYAILNYA
jgi:hypothetical protein